MKDAYCFIGAGGHAKVIVETVEDMGGKIGFLMDAHPSGPSLMGHEVRMQRDDIIREYAESQWIIAIGNNAIRRKIAEQFELRYAIAKHPSAHVSSRAVIGEGTVIMAGCSVNAEAVIGRHVILNTNCSVDHECNIGSYVHISPNAALGGNVTVGEGTHIGIGACVIQGITIGKECTIGAGAVIIKNVPDGATVVGNPGKIIKIKNR
ncbi:acetyltransferase [Taibaiella koreensis]|uniref:acetyltransferase n=1 Tax=Taibaiella koreensis TaxID=1268548 RepID=UPI000E59E3F1|nr:acetyltransferase [Taibaiella koreensis]